MGSDTASALVRSDAVMSLMAFWVGVRPPTCDSTPSTASLSEICWNCLICAFESPACRVIAARPLVLSAFANVGSWVFQ